VQGFSRAEFSGSRVSAFVSALGLALGCAGGADLVTTCEDRGALHPICGFQNPEDLAPVGEGRFFVVSQMGDMLDRESKGSLAVFDSETEAVRVVYPVPETAPPSSRPEADARSTWGDPACSERSEHLNPHGLDLARLPDGRLRLIIVNHGRQESIEIFEVQDRGASVSVHWRGCVMPPEPMFFNDVVSLPDGGFLATHMMAGSPAWGFVRASLGFDTGVVYEWNSSRGWSEVAGTEAPFPNGIEISADGRDIYLNAYGSGQVRRISRDTGETLARMDAPRPDNLSWSREGRLLVASHTGSFSSQMKCQNLHQSACPLDFQILSLDPETLTGGAVFANVGAPMGAGTVAIDIGGELLIGSFAGDRLLRAPLGQVNAD
jgi:hypothetical protein